MTTLRRITRTPAGAFGLLVVIALAVVLVFAPLLAPYSFDQQDIPHRLQGPSPQHLLGTDHLGRDLLSRLLYGSRVALGVAFPSVLAALVDWAGLGPGSGYLGGAVDAAIILLTDTVQSFPALILALALLALIGPSTGSVMFVVALAFAPGYARVVRAGAGGAGIGLCGGGARPGRWPAAHCAAACAAQHRGSAYRVAGYGLAECHHPRGRLVLLGPGRAPAHAQLGVVLADGFGKIRQSPWPVMWASATLMLTRWASRCLAKRCVMRLIRNIDLPGFPKPGRSRREPCLPR
ncbi:MAG: hypothetical protein HC853_12580 [Anaerolineae bacterium]|nr:hypothetical protein [Anaerolineae bacterium]